MNKTEDSDFVASWQKVEEALKRLDGKSGGTFVLKETCVLG